MRLNAQLVNSNLFLWTASAELCFDLIATGLELSVVKPTPARKRRRTRRVILRGADIQLDITGVWSGAVKLSDQVKVRLIVDAFSIRKEAASPQRAVQPEAENIAQRKCVAAVKDIRSRRVQLAVALQREVAVIFKQQRIPILKVKVAKRLKFVAGSC